MNTITLNLGKEEFNRLVQYIDTMWRNTQPAGQEGYYNQLTSMRNYLADEWDKYYKKEESKIGASGEGTDLEEHDYLNRIEIYQDWDKPEIFWILDPEQFKVPKFKKI